MNKKLLSVVALLITISFASFAYAGSADSYPENDTPVAAEDSLLGIDNKDADPGWTVNQFTFSGIVTWLRSIGFANTDQENTFTENQTFSESIIIGSAISATDLAYPVWEKIDSNGEVVASCVVICSVLTDGAQDCLIRYYLMHDTPGVLTLESTLGP